ncbi:hypothetical protein COBT_002351, partial [Conglomerata obtusa]
MLNLIWQIVNILSATSYSVNSNETVSIGRFNVKKIIEPTNPSKISQTSQDNNPTNQQEFLQNISTYDTIQSRFYNSVKAQFFGGKKIKAVTVNTMEKIKGTKFGEKPSEKITHIDKVSVKRKMINFLEMFGIKLHEKNQLNS